MPESNPDTKHIAIGVDIGGTFTDVVVVDETTHAIHSAKVLTTVDRPENAVIAAVDEMLQQTGAAAGAIRTLVHGDNDAEGGRSIERVATGQYL